MEQTDHSPGYGAESVWALAAKSVQQSANFCSATFVYGHSATVGAAQLPSFEKLFGFSQSKAAFTDRPRDIRRTR